MRRYQLEAYKGRRKPQGPIRFKRGPKLGLQLGLHVLDATTGRPSALEEPVHTIENWKVQHRHVAELIETSFLDRRDGGRAWYHRLE